jgi:hypothetical protein
MGAAQRQLTSMQPSPVAHHRLYDSMMVVECRNRYDQQVACIVGIRGCLISVNTC